MEEVGASVQELQLHGLYHSCHEGKSDHITIFASRQFQREPTRDCEIEQVASFSMEALPERTSPATRRRIEKYLAAPGRAVVAPW